MQPSFFLSDIGDSFGRLLHRSCRAAMTMRLSLPLICSMGCAQAATVAFTFQTSADASAFGIPSAATPNLPTTVLGSGVFVPFGSAAYTEAGTVTFAMLPTGGFAPAFTMNAFTFSFDGGANTFSGTNNTVFGPPNAAGFPTFTNNYTVLSGTGSFSGATGYATATGISYRDPGAIAPSPITPVSGLGSGQITTAGLAPAPEPGSMALMGIGLTCAVLLVRRRRSK